LSWGEGRVVCSCRFFPAMSFFRASASPLAVPLAWLIGSLLWAPPASAEQAVPAPQAALGIIVKLKGQSAEASQQATGQDSYRARRLSRLAALAGYPSTMQWSQTGRSMSHLRLPTPLNNVQLARLVSKLEASGDVAWAEPNVMQSLHQAPPTPNPGATLNDSFVLTGQQWWHANVNMAPDPRLAGVPNLSDAWLIHHGATSGQTVVAVLDTGVLSLPELSGRLLPGYDFVSEVAYDRDPVSQQGRDADATDPGDWLTAEELRQTIYSDCHVQNSRWHGTAVAGIIGAAANNGAGVAGVHWHARILPVRVSGSCGAALNDIIDGMRWAVGLPVAGVALNPNPAKIVNLSFGGSGACGNAYQDTINELRQKGVLVVASAGNGHSAVTRPGNCSGVLSVGALNQTGLKANYSNFGPSVSVSTTSGDLGGSGAWGSRLGDTGLIVLGKDGTTSPTSPGVDKFFESQGTSFAAPMVSGVAALMWELNPGLTVDQVINGIKVSARPHVTSNYAAACSEQNPGRCVCTTSTCGAGILDAKRALEYAQAPDSFVSTHMLASVNIDSAKLQAAAAGGLDEPPPPPAPSSSSGGGSLDMVALCALGVALLGKALWGRQRRQQGARQERQAVNPLF
jgi:serine protease